MKDWIHSSFRRETTLFSSVCMAGLLLLVLQINCVLPNEKLSGIAMSWSLLESGAIVKTENPTIRSCTGAGAEFIEIHVQDLNDDQRYRSWTFPCLHGMNHPGDDESSQPDVFLELHPSHYGISLRAWGSEAKGRPLLAYSDQEVPIDSGITSHLWLATLLPLNFGLELLHVEACQNVAFRLEYANPEQDILLIQNPSPEMNDIPSTLPTDYRPSLTSDDLLKIDGLPQVCSELVDGIHNFSNIDRGAYNLIVKIDGRVCRYPMLIEQSNSSPLQIDLAKLDC